MVESNTRPKSCVNLLWSTEGNPLVIMSARFSNCRYVVQGKRLVDEVFSSEVIGDVDRHALF